MIQYVIEPMKEVEYLCQWIKDYFAKNASANTYAIVGISGGKDSTVTAALLAKALGKERVLGVLMPQGEQHDIADAEAVIEYLGIKSIKINIEEPCNALYDAIEAGIEIKESKDSQIRTNTPARIRMATLYAVSANVGGRVANTCNASEDYLGYSTKFGDSAGDFGLLSSFTVREVKQLGYALGVPSKFLEKAPEDGMCGKTDEENFGFSYDVVDNFVRNRITPDADTYYKMNAMYTRGRHKTSVMPTYHNQTVHDGSFAYREKREYDF